MKNINDIKDKSIFLGWVLLLLFLMSFIWIILQPLQKHNLLRSVNRVFIENEDTRRITAGVEQKRGKSDLLGYWYSMFNSSDKMFVFAVMQDGILIPLGAEVSSDGIVSDIIPLSAHAKQVIDKLPRNILQIYITRIETAFIENNIGEKKE